MSETVTTIDSLLAELADVMGLDEMPEQERDELFGLMMETVMQNAVLATAEVVNDEDRSMIDRQAQALSLPMFLEWISDTHEVFFTAMMVEFDGLMTRLKEDLEE